MDVRCDRCQTEYELDDDSVTEGGASVQCTTCGHTFVVGPDGITMAPTPPAGRAALGGAPGGASGSAGASPSAPAVPHAPAGPEAEGPQAAEWLLACDDGQTHRFRDLTTLQKWIVERKVTRQDRLSQRGGRWRHLAEVAELQPFFEVVSQADRAHSPDEGRRPSRQPALFTSGSTPTRPTSLPRQAAARMSRENPAEPDPFAQARSSYAGRPSAQSTAVLEPEADFREGSGTMSLAPPFRRLKIFGTLAVLGLAAVSAYVGFKQPHWLPFFSSQEKSDLARTPPSPQPPPAATAESPAAPAVPPSAVAAAPVGPTAAKSAPSPAAAAPAPVAAQAAPPPSSGPRGPSPGMRRSMAAGALSNPGGAASPAASASGKTYQRLVADADRLLENGQTVKAQKLLDEALAIQPNGVAALTGSAFLLLDRQKALAAISTFKRALGYSPGYAPALFGLAEAYRARGDMAPAIENYRRFLDVAAGSPDAPAARRQLKELEGSLPRRKAEAASAGTPEAETTEDSERSTPAEP